jgi:1-acyl-sn-glycerol-3-phosphate acyltransferase
MEFALLLAAAAAVAMVCWWWEGRRPGAVLFFGIVRGYAKLWHRWSSPDPDPLPAHGPVLLVSNHTCSADPPFLQAGCGRPLAWLASREHYEIHPVIRTVLDALDCVPVRRTGKDAMAARGGLRRLHRGRALCVFPEGNLSGVRKRRLRTPKAGAAWLALRSDAVVIPAYIAGGPRTHRLLESWLLPWQNPVRVYFGRPLDLQRFRGQRITRRLLEEVSIVLMTEIEALRWHRKTRSPARAGSSPTREGLS